MVKLAGPAMSMAASGSLAGAMVFSTWKGRAYARSLVTPSNPRSAAQTGIRAMLRFLAQSWAPLSAPDKATWEPLADATNISPFNAYVAHNMLRWRDNRGPTDQYPAEELGTPDNAATLTATAGERSIVLQTDGTSLDSVRAYALFRKSGSAPALAWNECIRIIPWVNGPITFVDSPLEPGTYYYKLVTLSDDGILTDAAQQDDATIS